MIYTELTKKAMKISFNAHKNQVDKTGVPNVYHPMHLAEKMKEEYSCCVALLHDVVEDTDMTFEDLEKEGFPKEVIDDSIPSKWVSVVTIQKVKDGARTKTIVTIPQYDEYGVISSILIMH